MGNQEAHREALSRRKLVIGVREILKYSSRSFLCKEHLKDLFWGTFLGGGGSNSDKRIGSGLLTGQINNLHHILMFN